MKTRINPFLRRAALVLVGSIFVAGQSAQADSGTWNVDTDGLWSLDTNWSGNTIADGSGFTANFTNDITADRTVHLDSDRTLTNLAFGDSDTATAGSWILDNNGTFTNNLILAGTTPTITVNTLGTGKTATISAIIEGSAGLTKDGAGTLVLSGANTYSGGTKVSAGILSVSSDGNFGATAALNAITLNGGTLQTTAGFTLNALHALALATSTTSTIDTGANNLATASAVTGSGSLIKIGSGKLTYGASTTPHTNSGTITVLNGTLEASRQNGLSTTALGSGTIYLGDTSGSNTATLNWLGYGTYSNNMIVQAGSSGTKTISKNTSGGSNNSSTLSGTLTLDENVSITNTINNANTFTFSNTISGSGGISFSGTTGANVLSGTNTFTGSVTVTAGILSYTVADTVANANSLGKSGNAASNLLLGNGTTLQYTGAGGSTDRLFTSNGTAAGHGATLNASGAGAINYTNTGAIAYGATDQTRTLTLTGTNTGSNTLAAAIGNNGTGAVAVTKSLAGTWTLSGTNTYTGLTTVSTGTLALTGSNSGNSNIVLSNNVTLAFNSGSALGTGSLLGAGGSSSNYGVGATYQTLGTSPISIGLSTAAGIRTASNADVNIKFTSGAGSTAAVTWTTDFLILSVAGPQTIAVDNIGGVTFAGANFKVGIGASSATTSLIKGSQPVTISGVVSKGNGTDLSLTYAGSSTLTLSNGANAYAGATTVQSGSVVVGANAPSTAVGALGNASSAIVLGNGSTAASDAPSLLINGSFTVGRDIAVGSLTNTNAYNATIGGSNTTGTSTYTGNITLNTTATNYTATLQAATGGTTEFMTGTWTTNDKAIAIGSAGNTGTVILSNAIATTGGVNVNHGTLAVNGTVTGPLVTNNGATLAGTGPIVGAVNIGAGGHQAFAVAASSGAQVTRTITGTLTLDPGHILDLTAASNPAADTYTLVTTTGGITGVPGTVNLSGLSGTVTKSLDNLSLILTVGAASGYDSWMANLVSGGYTGDQTAGGDTDSDDMTNLMEYVLNGNPGVSDVTILPDLDVTATDFVFTFTRRLQSDGDTTQTFEYGANLTGWTPVNITSPVGAQVTLGTPSGTAPNQLQTVIVTIPKTESVAGKLFGRLKVVK